MSGTPLEMSQEPESLFKLPLLSKTGGDLCFWSPLVTVSPGDLSVSRYRPDSDSGLGVPGVGGRGSCEPNTRVLSAMSMSTILHITCFVKNIENECIP